MQGDPMSMIDQNIARQFDHLPPHSVEAEQCALGSVYKDPSVFPEVRAIIGKGDAFFQADHGIIWGVLCDMHERGKPFSITLIRDELNRRQLLEEVGGVEYMAACFGTMPSGALGVHYAKSIAEMF